MCIRHGADVLGFVVEYPRPVPWNLSAAAARELLAAVGKPTQTCVVTGGSPDHVLRMADATKPDYIQLHGGETLADTTCLVGELAKRGIKVIKALFPDTPDLEKAAVDFCAAGVYALLFDPRTPANASHSGTADLPAYRRLRRAASCPTILAGGITPENAREIVRQTQARMIDLMSGVEISPGIKDAVKLAALFRALRGGSRP
ncbi:MAG: phosphoribosylanthranilate isomerase [Betaproteobacteria bacterium]|nr:phosphoribosylanthranilate isomerase [Betaproteobacteria bacterium]